MEEKFLDILHTIESKIAKLKEVTVHEVELIAFDARHDIGRLVEKAKHHIKLGHTNEHLEGLQPPTPPAQQPAPTHSVIVHEEEYVVPLVMLDLAASLQTAEQPEQPEPQPESFEPEGGRSGGAGAAGDWNEPASNASMDEVAVDTLDNTSSTDSISAE